MSAARKGEPMSYT